MSTSELLLPLNLALQVPMRHVETPQRLWSCPLDSLCLPILMLHSIHPLLLLPFLILLPFIVLKTSWVLTHQLHAGRNSMHKFAQPYCNCFGVGG